MQEPESPDSMLTRVLQERAKEAQWRRDNATRRKKLKNAEKLLDDTNGTNVLTSDSLKRRTQLQQQQQQQLLGGTMTSTTTGATATATVSNSNASRVNTNGRNCSAASSRPPLSNTNNNNSNNAQLQRQLIQPPQATAPKQQRHQQPVAPQDAEDTASTIAASAISQVSAVSKPTSSQGTATSLCRVGGFLPSIPSRKSSNSASSSNSKTQQGVVRNEASQPPQCANPFPHQQQQQPLLLPSQNRIEQENSRKKTETEVMASLDNFLLLEHRVHEWCETQQLSKPTQQQQQKEEKEEKDEPKAVSVAFPTTDETEKRDGENKSDEKQRDVEETAAQHPEEQRDDQLIVDHTNLHFKNAAAPTITTTRTSSLSSASKRRAASASTPSSTVAQEQRSSFHPNGKTTSVTISSKPSFQHRINNNNNNNNSKNNPSPITRVVSAPQLKARPGRPSTVEHHHSSRGRHDDDEQAAAAAQDDVVSIMRPPLHRMATPAAAVHSGSGARQQQGRSKSVTFDLMQNHGDVFVARNGVEFCVRDEADVSGVPSQLPPPKCSFTPSQLQLRSRSDAATSAAVAEGFDYDPEEAGKALRNNSSSNDNKGRSVVIDATFKATDPNAPRPVIVQQPFFSDDGSTLYEDDDLTMMGGAYAENSSPVCSRALPSSASASASSAAMGYEEEDGATGQRVFHTGYSMEEKTLLKSLARLDRRLLDKTNNSDVNPAANNSKKDSSSREGQQQQQQQELPGGAPFLLLQPRGGIVTGYASRKKQRIAGGQNYVR